MTGFTHHFLQMDLYIHDFLDLGYFKLFQSHVLVYILYVYIKSMIIELFLHVLSRVYKVLSIVYTRVYINMQKEALTKWKQTKAPEDGLAIRFRQKGQIKGQTKTLNNNSLYFSSTSVGWYVFSVFLVRAREDVEVLPLADQVYKAWISLPRQPGRLPTRPRRTPRKRGPDGEQVGRVKPRL